MRTQSPLKSHLLKKKNPSSVTNSLGQSWDTKLIPPTWRENTCRGRGWTRVFCIAGRCFNIWGLTIKSLVSHSYSPVSQKGKQASLRMTLLLRLLCEYWLLLLWVPPGTTCRQYRFYTQMALGQNNNQLNYLLQDFSALKAEVHLYVTSHPNVSNHISRRGDQAFFKESKWKIIKYNPLLIIRFPGRNTTCPLNSLPGCIH